MGIRHRSKGLSTNYMNEHLSSIFRDESLANKHVWELCEFWLSLMSSIGERDVGNAHSCAELGFGTVTGFSADAGAFHLRLYIQTFRIVTFRRKAWASEQRCCLFVHDIHNTPDYYKDCRPTLTHISTTDSLPTILDFSNTRNFFYYNKKNRKYYDYNFFLPAQHMHWWINGRIELISRIICEYLTDGVIWNAFISIMQVYFLLWLLCFGAVIIPLKEIKNSFPVNVRSKCNIFKNIHLTYWLSFHACYFLRVMFL